MFDDNLYDTIALVDFLDLGLAIRSFRIGTDGRVSTNEESSLLAALTELQANFTTACYIQLELRRIWLNRRFVEKYAISDRTENVHSHGQVPAWDELFAAGMEDGMLFPLIRDAYVVSSLVLSVSQDIVTVEQLELTPLVASQH